MSLQLSGTSGVLDNSGAFIAGTAVASTSGTSIDFTSIPSWVKRITVMFNGVSYSGTALPRVQLGTSGGIVSSGYSGSFQGASTANLSAGFDVGSGYSGPSNTWNGQYIISNFTGNTWTATAVIGGSNAAFMAFMAGIVPLSGTLTQIRITNNSTDTFDAGSINILYE